MVNPLIANKFGDVIMHLSYMDTREKQMRGLQHVASLDGDKGLLFPTHGGAGYHMRNVRFSIDICYVRDDNIITAIDTVRPEVDTSVAPPESSWAVEANAGWFNSNGYVVGDEIDLRV